MLAEKRRMQGVLEVKHGHMKILKKLIELGVDLTVKDVAGRTFLHHCFSGCGNATTTAMAEVVLKAGLDPNIQDRFGYTPLFCCMNACSCSSMAPIQASRTSIMAFLAGVLLSSLTNNVSINFNINV